MRSLFAVSQLNLASSNHDIMEVCSFQYPSDCCCLCCQSTTDPLWTIWLNYCIERVTDRENENLTVNEILLFQPSLHGQAASARTSEWHWEASKFESSFRLRFPEVSPRFHQSNDGDSTWLLSSPASPRKSAQRMTFSSNVWRDYATPAYSTHEK